MSAYKQNEVLVNFAGYKSQIGCYPTSNEQFEFSEELSQYKKIGVSIQFPHYDPLPPY